MHGSRVLGIPTLCGCERKARCRKRGSRRPPSRSRGPCGSARLRGFARTAAPCEGGYCRRRRVFERSKLGGCRRRDHPTWRRPCRRALASRLNRIAWDALHAPSCNRQALGPGSGSGRPSQRAPFRRCVQRKFRKRQSGLSDATRARSAGRTLSRRGQPGRTQSTRTACDRRAPELRRGGARWTRR